MTRRAIMSQLPSGRAFLKRSALRRKSGKEFLIFRPLILRTIRHWHKINISLGGLIAELAKTIIDLYGPIYPELNRKKDQIRLELTQESEKFSKTIGRGIKEFDRLVEQQESVSGKDAF